MNKIVIIKNPFDKKDKEIIEIDLVDQSVLDIVKNNIPIDLAVYASLNGGLITEDKWEDTFLKLGDELVILPILQGGGGGKDIVTVVALIALVATAGTAGYGLATFFGSANVAFFTGMYLLVGGFLVNSLLSPPAPSLDGFSQTSEFTQSFSFNPTTLQKQGVSIPIIYGRIRVYGNIIASHSETSEDATKQIINMLIALGEGPIGGVVNDDPSDLLLGEIEINGQPIANYPDIIAEERFGLINQDPISFFKETSTEVTPNRTVAFGTPIVHTTTSGVDDLEVTIAFPNGIHFVQDNGSIGEHSLGIKIEISVASANDYSTLVEKTLTDNRKGTLRRIYKASKTYEGGSPVSISSDNAYDIRITKTTEDETGSRFGDKTILNVVKEILDDPFEYPRLALIGIKALASESISGSIKFSALVDGKYIRVYDGSVWTWELSSNPAWVAWDILTQPILEGSDPSNFTVNRYDALNPNKLDLSAFFAWAEYCDELVPTSTEDPSDLEVRLRFDGTFDTDSTVWDAALRVASVSRAALIWRGNIVTVVIDKQTDSSQMFSLGSVIKNSYKQTFLNQSERSREIEMSFLDSEQDYKKTVVNIFNPHIVNTTRKVSFNLFGVTRASQVWREGQFRLGLNQLLRDTITFKCDIEALGSEVGDVIEFVSPTNSDVSSGRIIDISRDQLELTLDTTPVQENISVDTYQIIVSMPDDTTETRTVTDVTDNVVTINSVFSQTISRDAIYSFGVTGEVIREYRIKNITVDSNNKTELTCIEYSDAFYDDTIVALLQQDVFSPGTAEDLAVLNLAAEEEALITPEGIINRSAIITWDIPTEVTYARAEVWWKINNDGLTVWNNAGQTTGDTFVINQLEEETEFIIRVVSVDINEIKTSFEISPTVTFTTGSNTDFTDRSLFMTITGLQVSGTSSTTEFLGQEILIEWDEIPESDNPSTFDSDNPSVENFNDIPNYWILDYEITVTDFSDTARRVVYVTSPFYTYSFQNNVDDGISREVRFSVKVRDKYLRTGSNGTVISLSNPAPDTVSGITDRAVSRGFVLDFDLMNNDNDFAGTKIWASKVSPVDTSDDDDLIVRTTDNHFEYFPDSLGTWYYKLAAFDGFGESGLSISGEGSIIITDLSSSDISAPEPIGIDFISYCDTDNPSGGLNPSATESVCWSAGTILFNGTEYSIPSGFTTNRWIYWIEQNNVLSTSDDQSVIQPDFWLMGLNNDGEITVPFFTRVLSALVIQSHTITAEQIRAKTITANEIIVNGLDNSGNLDLTAIGNGDTDDITEGSSNFFASESGADVTLAQLAGVGVNILNPERTQFNATTPVDPVFLSNGTSSMSNEQAIIDTYSLKVTATGLDVIVYLALNADTYDIDITPNSKWIFSCWVYSSVSGTAKAQALMRAEDTTNHYTVNLDIAAINTWERVSGIIDLSSDASTKANIRLDFEGGNGEQIYWDGIMLEKQLGTNSTPSNFHFGGGFNTVGSLIDDVTYSKMLEAWKKSGDVTKIDGGQISATTITSAQITTGEFITLTAQIKAAVIETAHIKDLNVTNAKIENLTLGTGKIQDEAISVNGSAFTSAQSSITFSTSPVTFQTVSSIVSTGQSFKIWTSFDLHHREGRSYRITIDRVGGGTTTIYDSGNLRNEANNGSTTIQQSMNISLVDTPSAATYTYRVRMNTTDAAQGISVSSRSLIIEELKK